MVRKFEPEATTLAIGDGANDVNMITAAHIGIGIRGVEGSQAARASDYVIGEFKILRSLLFYYGRECYRRNTNLVKIYIIILFRLVIISLKTQLLYYHNSGIHSIMVLVLLIYMILGYINSITYSTPVYQQLSMPYLMNNIDKTS